jgi:hypothetical protein
MYSWGNGGGGGAIYFQTLFFVLMALFCYFFLYNETDLHFNFFFVSNRYDYFFGKKLTEEYIKAIIL